MIQPGNLPLEADRWTPFTRTLRFEGVDLTSATFKAQVRLTPDTPGTPEVDLATVTVANAEGVRFVAYSGGASTVAIRINEATMEGLPDAAETGEDLVLHWDLHITLGGLKQRWLYGTFTVRAGVTQ